jgi:hypothetical protein
MEVITLNKTAYVIFRKITVCIPEAQTQNVDFGKKLKMIFLEI